MAYHVIIVGFTFSFLLQICIEVCVNNLFLGEHYTNLANLIGIKVFNIYMDVCVYISTRVFCASEYNAALMLS